VGTRLRLHAADFKAFFTEHRKRSGCRSLNAAPQCRTPHRYRRTTIYAFENQPGHTLPSNQAWSARSPLETTFGLFPVAWVNRQLNANRAVRDGKVAPPCPTETEHEEGKAQAGMDYVCVPHFFGDDGVHPHGLDPGAALQDGGDGQEHYGSHDGYDGVHVGGAGVYADVPGHRALGEDGASTDREGPPHDSGQSGPLRSRIRAA